MNELMTVFDAMRRAQNELAAYLENSDPDAKVITAKLVKILNCPDVVSALDALYPKVMSPPVAPHAEAEPEAQKPTDELTDEEKALSILGASRRKTGNLRGVDILLAPFQSFSTTKKS